MAWARWSACLLALGLSSACKDSNDASEPLLNRCTQAFECTRNDRCDAQLGICVRDQVDRPYPVAVLVIPSESTFTRTSQVAPMFSGTGSFDDIRVRRAVSVSGSVTDNTSTSFEAEVAFIPQATSLLSEGVSAFTRRVGTENTYSAQLAPDTRYDVRVFPLGLESERLPPRTFTLDTATAPRSLPPFAYPELDTLPASILDENNKPPPAGSRVRLRNRASGEFVSSIGKPSLTDGLFDLDAPREVYDALSEHELVLEVPYGDAPQSVAIVFKGELMVAGARLVMPVLPRPVLYQFRVEVAGRDDLSNVNADATFVSSFPLPNSTSNSNLRNRDWCRLKLPGSIQGTFRCSETVKTSVVGTTGSARLLPGDYEIYVAPSGDIEDPLRVATYRRPEPEQIGTQSNDVPQAGQVFMLTPAAVYTGRVRSPVGTPMPSVTVTANALGIPLDLGEIARYNRTAEQVSDGRGRFLLTVDTGYYDLVAAQPEGSGFAWVLSYNRRIDVGTMTTLDVLPQTPVIARGTVITEASLASGPSRPLGQARVEAYAIVPNLDTGENRVVRIANTSTDESGNFALALPPYIGEPPAATTSADGGLGNSVNNISLDAGLGDAGRGLLSRAAQR